VLDATRRPAALMPALGNQLSAANCFDRAIFLVFCPEALSFGDIK